MSKIRVPQSERPSRRSTVKGQCSRFLGLSLSGGKADKACLAVLDYFPEHKKIFLLKIEEKIKSDENISADLKIHEMLEEHKDLTEVVAMDVPWQLPLCITCNFVCPGFENCKEPHIEWMWEASKKQNKKRNPKKLFTPYTQRAAEMYFAEEFEEPILIHHALGANLAPMVARANFIRKRSKLNFIEVHPKMALWRIGRSLQTTKADLKTHRNLSVGADSRAAILKQLSESNAVFLYEQDRKQMIENNHAFEAFICALTGYIYSRGWTEKKPKNFPPAESWIEVPEKKIPWKEK